MWRSVAEAQYRVARHDDDVEAKRREHVQRRCEPNVAVGLLQAAQQVLAHAHAGGDQVETELPHATPPADEGPVKSPRPFRSRGIVAATNAENASVANAFLGIPVTCLSHRPTEEPAIRGIDAAVFVLRSRASGETVPKLGSAGEIHASRPDRV